MKDIYTRNIPAISPDEQETLQTRRVLVVGCGGLGGYAVEYLARLGVGHIVAVDGDTFSESNLNRQLLSSIATLGQSKSEVAVDRIHSINPDIEAIAIKEFFNENNAVRLLDSIDLVIDALDNVAARFILEDACEKAGIIIVHGAVQGWNMQATVVQPGSRTLHSLYKVSDRSGRSNDIDIQDNQLNTDNHVNNNISDTDASNNTGDTDASNNTGDTDAGNNTGDTDASKVSSKDADDASSKTCLCPTPACCAAIQVSEALKILVGRESTLSGQMLFVDLLTMESYTIPLK